MHGTMLSFKSAKELIDKLLCALNINANCEGIEIGKQKSTMERAREQRYNAEKPMLRSFCLPTSLTH